MLCIERNLTFNCHFTQKVYSQWFENMSKHWISRKASTKITLTGTLQAAMRKVQISRQLRTTCRAIRRLGERFNANEVTNDSTRIERPRVTTHSRDRHFVTSHLRDRLKPAVVTARNTPGTHNNSATGPFSEIGLCCGE